MTVLLSIPSIPNCLPFCISYIYISSFKAWNGFYTFGTNIQIYVIQCLHSSVKVKL